MSEGVCKQGCTPARSVLVQQCQIRYWTCYTMRNEWSSCASEIITSPLVTKAVTLELYPIEASRIWHA